MNLFQFHKQNENSQKGATLAIMLVILGLLIVLTNVVLMRFLSEITLGSQTYLRYQSLNIAEAGIQKGIYELQHSGGSYKGEKNIPFAKGTFTIEVRPSSQASYQLVSTGIISSKSRYIQKTTVKALLKNQGGKLKILSWTEQDN